MKTYNWIPLTEYNSPKDGELVMTKIDDKDGERNVQSLKKQRNLWFVPDVCLLHPNAFCLS